MAQFVACVRAGIEHIQRMWLLLRIKELLSPYSLLLWGLHQDHEKRLTEYQVAYFLFSSQGSATLLLLQSLTEATGLSRATPGEILDEKKEEGGRQEIHMLYISVIRELSVHANTQLLSILLSYIERVEMRAYIY